MCTPRLPAAVVEEGHDAVKVREPKACVGHDRLALVEWIVQDGFEELQDWFGSCPFHCSVHEL